jgi:tetratricopeptide (TPR) repeat protein
LEIKSETSFGQIDNPEYWLYSIHPIIRNYLERTIQKAIGKSSHNLEKEYGVRFYIYYNDILYNAFNSIGKETNVHRSSIARFNLIFQSSENNDFARAISFAEHNNDLWYCANLSLAIGRILDSFGILSNALYYHKKSLGFNQERGDKNGISGDYKNIGIVYRNMGNNEQALEYYNKALAIDTELNRRVGLAGGYRNIGVAYSDMGNYEQALQYHNKALAIDTDLNDRVKMARDHYNLSFPLYAKNEKREEALQHLNIAKTILLDFQKETGYSHPLLKDVEDRISFIDKEKK